MRRILVVDDDPHVGQAIRVWLKHHGFCVATAESGSGGLAALDNASFDDASRGPWRVPWRDRRHSRADESHHGERRCTGRSKPRGREVIMTVCGLSVRALAGPRRNAPLLE